MEAIGVAGYYDLLKTGDTAICIHCGPVSYTHLDVYKRQVAEVRGLRAQFIGDVHI